MEIVIFIGLLIVAKGIFGNPRTASVIVTAIIVIWSASIETALGYGAMLMMTLPFCWVIYGVIRAIYWLVGGRLNQS